MLLATAVLARARAVAKDAPDASDGDAKSAAFAVLMLEPPPLGRQSTIPTEDPLLRRALAAGLDGLYDLRLAAPWGYEPDAADGVEWWRPATRGERLARFELGATQERARLRGAKARAGGFEAALKAARGRIERDERHVIGKPDAYRVNPTAYASRMIARPRAGGPQGPGDDPLLREARSANLRALWDMRLAVVWACEPAGPGAFRPAATAERLVRLDRAGKVEGAKSRYGEQEADAFEAVLKSGRRRILDQGVAQRLDEQPDLPAFDAPEVRQELVLEMVKQSIAAVDRVAGLQSRRFEATAATRFTPESVELQKRIAKAFADNAAMTKILKFPFPASLYVVKGLLNLVDVGLRLNDPKKLEQLKAPFVQKHGLRAADLALDIGFALQVCEGATALGGLGIALHLLKTQKTAEPALEWFKWVTARAPIAQGQISTSAMLRNNFLIPEGAATGTIAAPKGAFSASKFVLPLRTIGWLTAGIQVVTSAAVLLDTASTDSERLAAKLGLGLGAVGVAGAAFTGLGVRAAAGVGGYGTAFLLLVAAAAEGERAKLRQGEVTAAAEELIAAFAVVQGHAAAVVRDANALRESLDFEREALGRTVWSGAPRPEVAAAARRRAATQARALHERLEKLLEKPKDMFALQRIHAFDQVRLTVNGATKPEEVLAAAAEFLATVRDLFRHPDRSVARTLREWDREWRDERNALADIFGIHEGLHDSPSVRNVAEGKASDSSGVPLPPVDQLGKD